MPWVRLDDHFDEHPKIARLSATAGWLWVCGLAYCNRNLTDGFIPEATAYRLCSATEDEIVELTASGLWTTSTGGYTVHDYTDYQPSKAEVMEGRALNRQRQSKWYRSQKDKPNANLTPLDCDSNAVTNGTSNALLTHVPNPVPVPVPAPVPKPKREIFVAPNANEVATYCKEIGLPGAEGRKFYDYECSKGWKVGSEPMRDWQAALRNWKRNWEERGGNNGQDDEITRTIRKVRAEAEARKQHGK